MNPRAAFVSLSHLFARQIECSRMCNRLRESADSEDVGAAPSARPRSLRQIVDELGDSFDVGGIDGLHQTHLACLRESWQYRLLFGLVRLFLPITPLLTITRDLERLVGELGVHGASRVILARAPVPWEVRMPSRGEFEIRTGSIIVYGTHGSILTPLLLAAAIDRPDLKMVAADYIAKLGPNIAGCSFPVYAAVPVTVKRASDKGLVPRAMGWIACKSAAASDRDAARQWNRESLRQAAEYVRQGGGLLIAPESRDRRDPWRPGLGAVVANLAHDARGRPTYLVPWSIRGASVTGIFQLLSRNPLARRLATRRFRRPVRVAFGEPMLIQDVVAKAGDAPAEIAAYLERDYRERGF